MGIVLVTGSGGLIGSEAVRFFSAHFKKVIGIDNNMRQYFFGENASVQSNINSLVKSIHNYEHFSLDIRNYQGLEEIYKQHIDKIKLIIHTAAQPSHDWAAKEPLTDFGINAQGTLNMLELTRTYCPEAVFIFTSTNKVYGDTPNYLPLCELETRWEIDLKHPFYKEGVDESMTIDQSKHSIFGVSKVAADVMAQEYGRYFGMNIGIFRGGCLSGPNHRGEKLHGFLAYLMKCAFKKEEYTIFGYKGKQVRDNIHSEDLINMFCQFYNNPKKGEVYNAGGGRYSNCSMLEAINLCQEITGDKMNIKYSETNRIGDHIWWISDVSKFKRDFPDWNWRFDVRSILTEIHSTLKEAGK